MDQTSLQVRRRQSGSAEEVRGSLYSWWEADVKPAQGTQGHTCSGHLSDHWGSVLPMTHFPQSNFPQSNSLNPKSTASATTAPDRWQHYLGRARTCFRAATAIDSTTHALIDAATALEGATDSAAEEAVIALHQAERALARARECLAMALEAKKLTPANREPSYGLCSYDSRTSDSSHS